MWVFGQVPLIPAFRASADNCLERNNVTIRIGVWGDVLMICFAASNPFISGIWKSSTIKS